MKRAYYARPISIDGTPQEERDHDLINMLGFAVYPVGKEKEEILKGYPTHGMEVFKEPVESSYVLIFRAFPDGTIGAGVGKEIEWAEAVGIPVLEIPRQITRRVLSVSETREMLAELGQR